MLKKALVLAALLGLLAFLVYHFFKPDKTFAENQNLLRLIPSNAISFKIVNEEDENFLGFEAIGNSVFVTKEFPEYTAGCLLLKDSLLINDSTQTSQFTPLETYSKQAIYQHKANYFFVDGRKVFYSKKMVLLKQLLLKVQDQDFLSYRAEQYQVLEIIKNAPKVFVHLKEPEIYIEYNEVNGIASAYSLSKQNSKLPVQALNFVPLKAQQVRLREDTIAFTLDKDTFQIFPNPSQQTLCKERYRDAFLCPRHEKVLAHIQNLCISATNEALVKEVLNAFYEQAAYKVTNLPEDLFSDVFTVDVLPSSLRLLLPEALINRLFYARKSPKELRVYQSFSREELSNQAGKSSDGTYRVNFKESIVYGPFIVKNHRSKDPCVLVQTLDNQLHYLNHQGKVLWKKQLGGLILGDIQTIDRYHNNKVQYLFNTATALYELDVLGRDLEGFPKQIKSTGPALLVQYKPKKERILIPSGRQILNLYLDGQNTRGWIKNTLKSDVLYLAYSKIGRRDCILAQCKEHVYVLNPRGKERSASVSILPKSVVTLDSKEVLSHIFSLNDDKKLLLGTNETTTLEPFSDSKYDTLLLLGDYVAALSKQQLTLFSDQGNLVENKYLDEAPQVFKNGLLYRENQDYEAFLSPGKRFSLAPNENLVNLDNMQNMMVYSSKNTVYFKELD